MKSTITTKAARGQTFAQSTSRDSSSHMVDTGMTKTMGGGMRSVSHSLSGDSVTPVKGKEGKKF